MHPNVNCHFTHVVPKPASVSFFHETQREMLLLSSIKMKVVGDQGLSNSREREREHYNSTISKYSTCLLKPYDSFVRRMTFTVSNFSLKLLLDSCGLHSLPLYIKEQL